METVHVAVSLNIQELFQNIKMNKHAFFFTVYWLITDFWLRDI